jgi:hypothetical protein
MVKLHTNICNFWQDRHQFVSEVFENGIVKVESFDAVKIEQRKHRTKRRQQDSILDLKQKKFLFTTGPNPTTSIYNGSVVKFYNATSSF